MVALKTGLGMFRISNNVPRIQFDSPSEPCSREFILSRSIRLWLVLVWRVRVARGS